MPQEFTIIYLADAREFVVPLAPLFIEEWEPYYGRQGPGDAETDLNDCCNKDEIPLALVAVDADGEILGTASLKAKSIDTHRHLGPWLATLFVVERHRGRGINAALVAAIEENAVRLGFERIYVGARGVTSSMRENGWMLLDEVSSMRGPIEIYEKELSN